MEHSAVYICIAAIAALLIPVHAPQEAFKIEFDPGVQWTNVMSTCKKPFAYLSDNVKNKIYVPTKEGLARAVPFKPYFRKRKRIKMLAKTESMRKQRDKERISGHTEGLGKYRERNAKPNAVK